MKRAWSSISRPPKSSARPCPAPACSCWAASTRPAAWACPRATFEEWLKAGDIEYLGRSDDVAAHLHRADCVVLPSYREGTPKTLLEAAAVGKPLVTTDVPGCRETVVDGRNGYLCQVRSAGDLAAKMLQVLRLPDADLRGMGQNSRYLAETKFDEQLVLDKYLTAVATVGRR